MSTRPCLEILHMDGLIVILFDRGESLADQHRHVEIVQLCQSVGLDPSEEYRQRKDAAGRPWLERKGSIVASLSFSHAGRFTLAGLSLNGPIGLDLTRHDTSLSWTELARELFTEEEQAWLLAHGQEPPTLARQGSRLWSRKEAVAKCLGEGVSWIERRLSVLANETLQYRLCDLRAIAGHEASLALLKVAPTACKPLRVA